MPKNTRLLPAIFVIVGGFAFGAEPVSGAAAPAPDAKIEQIVVVAHKDQRPLSDIAANVTAMSRADLAAELAISMSDLFRYVPGVDYEAAGTRFGTEGINIRGIGGNRVAMLVDGVPLTDQFDTGSFSNATRDFIDAGLIQQIEVLHGPASALYGSSAIGGVVAIRTPDPADIVRRDGFGGDVLGTWRGADSSTQGQAMFAYGDNTLGVVAAYSVRDGAHQQSAAAENDLDRRNYHRETALLKFVVDNRFGQTVRASAIRQQGRSRTAINSVLGSGRYRSTTALAGDDEQRLDVVTFAYEFGSPESWVDSGTLRVFHEHAWFDQSTLDERGAARTPVSIDRFFSFDQQVLGLELNLWKDLDVAGAEHRIGMGIEYRERTTEEFRDGLSTDMATGLTTNVLLGEVFPLRDFPISDTTETGVFVEDSFALGADWKVIAALRYDIYRMHPRVDAVYREDYPDYAPVTLDVSHASPKLGLIYSVNDGTEVYFQYSHGFRAPPYSDANVSLDLPLFRYSAIPNPDLEPETSDGFDLGFRWQGLQSSARIAIFYSDYDNFIESKVNIGVDPASGYTQFQSQNLEDTTISGIEAGWSLGFGDRGQFRFDGSAYYARGANRISDAPINSVGPAQAVLGIAWSSASEARELRLKTTLTADYDRLDESAGELAKSGGHAVFDLFLSQKLGENMAVRIGALNLTDRTYWNWSDIRGIGADDPMLPYLAEAGRSASISLNVTW